MRSAGGRISRAEGRFVKVSARSGCERTLLASGLRAEVLRQHTRY